MLDISGSAYRRLLADLKHGSQQAFKIIYDMHAPVLYSFAFSLTKSRDDAADLVQEVFVRLWENRDKVSEDRPLEPFLFTIGKNLFVSAYRKRITSLRYTEYAEYLDTFTASETASAAIEYDEYRRSIWNAFKTLPLRQRQIVHLSKWKGMKNSEIAEKLNLSEQTVKNQLSLGLKGLKLSLAKYPLPAMLLIIRLFILRY